MEQNRTEPKERIDHMKYLEGMEVLDSDIDKLVL